MKTQPPNLPENADPLDALLRDADEYVPDNGFTARVVQHLPPRRRRWRRYTLVSLALVISTGLAAWQSPGLFDIFTAPQHWPALLQWPALLGFVPVLAVLASLGWGLFNLVTEEE